MSPRARALAAAAAFFALFVVLAAVFWLQASSEDGASSAAWSRAAGVLAGPLVLPVLVLGAAGLLAVFDRLVAARFLLVGVAGAGVLMYASRVVLQALGADDDGGRLADYPSGHATVSTATAAACVAIVWAETRRAGARWAVAAFGGAVVLGVSAARLDTGAHSLVDVLGGIALGLGWIAVCIAVLPPSGERGPTRTGWLISTLVAATAGFVLLAILYDHEPFTSVDEEVATWVATSLPVWVETLAMPFSWLGGWVGIASLTVVAAVMLLRERRWLDLGFLLVAVVGSAIAVALFKMWFDRPRPDAGSPIPLPESASFPSGHAVSGIASLGALTVLAGESIASARARRWLWGSAAVVGFTVGLSRIALNVHYVTDVLAGWCFGIAWLSACLLARERLRASG